MFRNLMKMLALLLIFHNTAFSQQILQYNLKVNDTFTFLQKADQNIVQTIDGSKHVIDNSIESVFTFYVNKITDSSYIMDFKFDKFVMNTNSNLYGKLFDVNTDSIDMNNPEARIFIALTQSNLSLEMLKTGKIINLRGTDALVKKMIDGAGYENEFTRAVMTESMKKEFGKNKMINSLEQFTFFHSKKAVTTKDTWTNSFSGAYNSTNTWQLESINKGNVFIHGRGQTSMKTEDDSMLMTLKGSSTTDITCQQNNGIATKMVVESTMQGTTTLKNMESIELPTTIISKTTYKALKNVQQNF